MKKIILTLILTLFLSSCVTDYFLVWELDNGKESWDWVEVEFESEEDLKLIIWEGVENEIIEMADETEKNETESKKISKNESDFISKTEKNILEIKEINFEIKFLDKTKQIEKLEFFKKDFDKVDGDVFWNYFEKDTEYYKIADLDLKEWKWELILLDASAFYSHWGDMLYFVNYQNKYYFLPSISTWWKYDDSKNYLLDLRDFEKKFSIKNIEFYKENKFKNILNLYKIPKKIEFTKNWKDYNLEFINKKPYFLTKDILQNFRKIDFIKGTDKDLYIEKTWNKIWWNSEHRKLKKIRDNNFKKFEKLDEKVKNDFNKIDNRIDFFKSDAIFMKMPDNSVTLYNLKIPFESKKEHIYPDWGKQMDDWIILNEKWKKQDIFHYSYMENSSCWVKNWTYMYVLNWVYEFDPYRIAIWDKKWFEYADKIKIEDTIFKYKNNNLIKIWEFIRNDWKTEEAFKLDKNSSFMKAMYKYWYYAQLDDYWCLDEKWNFKKNDEECGYQNFLDYEKFIKINPLLFWKDPFRRNVLFLSWKVSQPSACWAKPVIYLYPEKKQDIKVKLNWKKNNLLSVPKYENSWEVISDNNSNIFDKKTKKVYPYLFWEDLMKYKTPEKWFVIKKEKLSESFDNKLKYINLNKKEISEFKKYWLPQMKNYPYYFVTFLQTKELNKIVPIEINPKPDNIWRIFMDFKWLDKYRKVEELKLEKIKRNWFYVVEWGGNKK